jgi:hypothetical protein
MEKFLPIKEFNDEYSVSDCGRVYSNKKNKFISINPGSNGYLIVTLFRNAKRYTRYVHRLVAIAFMENKSPLVVNHIDGNKQNNYLSNLEWITQSENSIHSAYYVNRESVKTEREHPLSEIEIANLIDDYINGMTTREIIKKYHTNNYDNYISKELKRRITKRKPKRFEIELDENILEIPEFPLYYISDKGNIYSAKIGRKMTPTINLGGYKQIKLTHNGKEKTISVHRLVAICFIDNPENKKVVNHINHIITDNRVKNLEWVTHKENSNR